MGWSKFLKSREPHGNTDTDVYANYSKHCEVCQHCQGPVTRDESVREGYSYHKDCHKCYVCSETNLYNAEVFKGVIFCSSCSQRIFQGCSTARKVKTAQGSKRSKSKTGNRRREKVRAQDRQNNRVIELARLGGSIDSDSRSNSDNQRKEPKSQTLEQSMGVTMSSGKQICQESAKDIKRNSAEIGTTTTVTQKMLNEINSVTLECKTKPTPSVKPHRKHRSNKQYNDGCSDLRIAELGQSTEIAHMTLRKQSEMPVVVNSETHAKHSEYDSITSVSQLTENLTDASGDGEIDWVESAYSNFFKSTHLMDRRIGSLLKLPYKFFQRNILARSSLISAIMTLEDDRNSILERLKLLFRHDIIDHQHRGIKNLYSTINKSKTPHKLGWLKLKSLDPNYIRCVKQGIQPRCKHFKASHSYRCMRAHVMKRAGPTKSELACFHRRLKNIVMFTFLKNLIKSKCRYGKMSAACGSEAVTNRSLCRQICTKN